jgi:hypothetical protein
MEITCTNCLDSVGSVSLSMNVKAASSLLRQIASLCLVFASGTLISRADVFTYTGATNNSWSTVTNWLDTSAPPTDTTLYPSTTSDTASISYAGTGTQVVIYDANVDGAGNGALGTLNLTNTGTGTDEVDYQKMVGTITNSFTLGSATGTDELIIDSPPRAPSSTGFSSTLTLGSGGVGGSTLTVAAGGLLILRGTVSPNSNTTVDINGNVALSGGAINIDEGQVEPGSGGGSPNSYFSGNFTMSSGTMTFGTTPVINPGNSSTLVGNTRLTINGNTNITGGAINIVAGTSNAEIFMNGATNTFNGVTIASNMQLAFDAASLQTQSLTSDSVLSALQDRNAYSNGSNLTNTVTVTDTNTSATGNIGQFSYLNQANKNLTTSVLVLGSNLTATAGGGNNLQAANYAYGFTGTLNYVVDLQGHTYNMANTTTIFKPNSPVTGTANSVQGDWTIESTTGGTGTIEAAGFDFSNSNTASAYSVTVGSNVVLEATGVGVTDNLGYLAGSIDPTSTFFYSPNTTSTNTSLFTTSQAIGNLHLRPGLALNSTLTFFNIPNTGVVTAKGNTQVDANAILDLYGNGLAIGGTTGLTGGGQVVSSQSGGTVNFTGSGGIQPSPTIGSTTPFHLTLDATGGSMTVTLATGNISHFNFNSGTSYDSVIFGSNVAMIYGGNLTLDFTSGYAPTSGTMFTLFAPDADGTDTASGNFANITSNITGDMFSFNDLTGILTVSAVPEPSIKQLLVMMLLAGLGVKFWAKRTGSRLFCNDDL